MEWNPGTRVPENPGKPEPANFQTRKPGFVSVQKPGFDGFTFGCQLAVFECSGVRSRILYGFNSYLQSIPPMSVEAERAFSTAGILCTKICSRLRVLVTRHLIPCASYAAIISRAYRTDRRSRNLRKKLELNRMLLAAWSRLFRVPETFRHTPY